MSQNRVIGFQNRIPWHFSEDFRWFKRTTLGHTLVMGRKTFESIGRPLPGRTTLVLSRGGFACESVGIIGSLEEIDPGQCPGDVFICGGAEIYRQALPYCRDLFLTLVKQEVPGDAFFPEFEDRFRLDEVLTETPDFDIKHYVQRAPRLPPIWREGV